MLDFHCSVVKSAQTILYEASTHICIAYLDVSILKGPVTRFGRDSTGALVCASCPAVGSTDMVGSFIPVDGAASLLK